MPKLQLTFDKGILKPANIASTILRPTPAGFSSYAQNIDVQSDEFGQFQILPGPALNTITNNSELTGVPHTRARLLGISSAGFDKILFTEGILGAANVVRMVEDVETGGAPQIKASTSVSATHGGHSTPTIQDIDVHNGLTLVAVGVDATDVWIQKSDCTSGAPGAFSLVDTATISADSLSSTDHRLILGDDGNYYISCNKRPTAYLLKLASDLTTVTAQIFTIPRGKQTTALGKYQTYLAIAYGEISTNAFTNRNVAQESGIILWAYDSTTQYVRDIPCPANYISAIVKDPSGNTLVFGGKNDGRTTIYQFTGFGFEPLYSYIGEMPRSRHSIDFDSQRRIIWTTADGQILRFDPLSGKFDHLGSITTGSSAGGILIKLLGLGNDFLATAGSGSTYTMKKVVFGNYIGDGASSDTINTPLIISGNQSLPAKSIVKNINIKLNRNLVTGEKIEVRFYKNGSTTAATYGSLSYATDGAIGAKTIRYMIQGVNEFAFGFAYKMSDNQTTAPAIVSAEVEYSTTNFHT